MIIHKKYDIIFPDKQVGGTSMINYSIVGRNIKELREEAGISQRDLAESADISLRWLRDLENGKVENISLNTIVRISQRLNCSLSNLVLDTLPTKDTLATATNMQFVIDSTNYLYLNPFRKISTFCELFMILPLINLQDLYEISSRVGGHIFGNEDYIAQAVGYAYKHIPDNEAKSYVQTMLELIESKPWEGNTNSSASEALAEQFEELCKDPSFIQKYEAYDKVIKDKLTMAKFLEAFVKSYNSVTKTKNNIF